MPGMSASHIRAVLLDALGTTVRLRPPWEEVDPALVEGLPPERVRAAFAAEMSYYGDHAHEATDPVRLAELRARCAALLGEGLGRPVSLEALMGSIVFEAYPDAAPALDELRALGLRLVCVSNWDCALAEVLARIGLAERFDGVVASALAGARKPDPALFLPALETAGCRAAEALHVGDTDADVEGARAAGIGVLRIDRGGDGDIASLAEIVTAVRPATAMRQHPRP